MSDYQKAMLHFELALLRVRDRLRSEGETCIEDALHAVAGEIASLSAEERAFNPNARKTLGPQDAGS